jgi:hypothetical protein
VNPRFQADNDLRSVIRTGVLRREPAIDFQSAGEAQLHGVSDPDVLRLATEQHRILISHGSEFHAGHFRDYLRVGNHSPVVLILPQEARVADAIESIVLIWIASEAEEWIDRIDWLPDESVHLFARRVTF